MDLTQQRSLTGLHHTTLSQKDAICATKKDSTSCTRETWQHWTKEKKYIQCADTDWKLCYPSPEVSIFKIQNLQTIYIIYLFIYLFIVEGGILE